MLIAIDFDGTLVEHKYPEIGKEIPFAFETLKRLQADGHRLILWSVREGRLLDEAVDDIDDLMMLCEADITSKNEARKQKFLDNFKLVRQKLKDLEEKDRIRNFQPPVDGEEIMRVFDMKPCREIGSLKSAIKDAILDGVIPNEHDAAFEYMLKKAKQMKLTPKNL